MNPPPTDAGATRTVVTPAEVDRLVFFPFSSVMPESTAWEVNRLPRLKKEPHTGRVLLILGNVAHFAGDMPLRFWSHILALTDWDHFIYVPGPYDYGSGTLELGDSYLRALHKLDQRLTVFAHGSPLTAVFFTGPRILVRGAACFPVETVHYQEAAVYQRGPGNVPTLVDDTMVEANKVADHEAIVEALWVTRARAQGRLDKDVETLLKVNVPEAAAHVIVSYGCPDEMAAATRKKSPFHAVVKLGDAKTYKRFADIGATFWFCGAPTDKLTYAMYKSPTVLCSNCFLPGPRKLPCMTGYLVQGKPSDKQ